MNYFFARVINKLGLSNKLNFSITKIVNGKKVIIPVVNGHGIANFGISELWMCALIKKVLEIRKGVFIDVGVNIGQTIIKLRTIDNSVDYIGFEPNPLCVYYSGQLIKANGYTNTRLIPVGIFNENGVIALNLYSEGGTDASASMIDNFRPNEKVYQKIFVPVARFENIKAMLGIKEIAIVKIDVEGAELEVLESMEDTLESLRPFIFIEILPCYTNENTERINHQLQLEQLLKRIRYNIFRVIKQDSNTIKELQALDTIGIHSDMDLCEYVMAPQETATEVTAFF